LVFNLETGALIKKISTGATGDNGLATPGLTSSTNDGITDFAYAGDLQGNVWKFDLSNPDPAQWNVANGGAPFYVARNTSNQPQPITAPIRVVKNFVATDPNFGKLFVHFGTGSYFRLGDTADNRIQSWYGLIDQGLPITNGRTDLVQRSMSATSVFAGRDVRTFDGGSAGDTSGKKGWFLDLFQTERIVTASNTAKAVEAVLFASIVRPLADECTAGGTGFVAAINPFSGAALIKPLFDVNNDRNFLNDVVGSANIGAVDLGVGMPGEAILIGNRLVVGGSSGTMSSIRVNLGLTPVKGRLTWREIVRD
jgi:type IV pilus assembly protein PilY1